MKCGEGIGGRIEHCFEESGGRKYKTFIRHRFMNLFTHKHSLVSIFLFDMSSSQVKCRTLSTYNLLVVMVFGITQRL